MGQRNGEWMFVVDSNTSNIGRKAPRQYYGADIQLAASHGWGKTEIRAEYWRGKQPGTATTTVNPGTLPPGPTYIHPFDAAFFYFLQNIVNSKWELMAKYDWYDPNTRVPGNAIGKPGNNLTVADIRYGTLGIGFTRYFSGNLKFLIYYDIVRNEETQLAGYTEDLEDNVFTFRVQLRF
jgi:predicted porin